MVLFNLALATILAAVPFDRYQSIVDRQMFGPVPKGFDPTKNPADVKANGKAAEKELTKEQEQLQASIHFSMINITPSGAVAVGFTDNSDSKNPVHYYLKVGEVRNGWEVKEADPVKAWMKIAKGEVEVECELGGKSGKQSGGSSDAPGAGVAGKPGNGGGRGAAALPANGLRGRSGLLGTAKSLRARREEREAQQREREAKAAEEKAAREEREAQRDAEFQEMKEQLRQRDEREAAEKAEREAEKAAREAEKAEREAEKSPEQEEPATLQEDAPND